MTDDRLSKIRKLLAQAESTQFPSEAETFTAKAEALMVEWGLEDADLWANQSDGHRAKPVVSKIEILGSYTMARISLLASIAKPLNVQVFYFASRPSDISLIGFRGDIELVELLYTSVSLQLPRAMSRSEQEVRPPNIKAFRRSFIIGFGGTIGRRLRQRFEDVTNGESQALVLVDRKEAVDDFLKQEYGSVRKQKISYSSTDGLSAGGAAGASADLSTPGSTVQTSRRELL